MSTRPDLDLPDQRYLLAYALAAHDLDLPANERTWATLSSAQHVTYLDEAARYLTDLATTAHRASTTYYSLRYRPQDTLITEAITDGGESLTLPGGQVVHVWTDLADADREYRRRRYYAELIGLADTFGERVDLVCFTIDTAIHPVPAPPPGDDEPPF
ncbi:hypothetical protein ACWDUL_21210 [Nocardia niigatensis]